jgi:hypothetical protein
MRREEKYSNESGSNPIESSEFLQTRDDDRESLINKLLGLRDGANTSTSGSFPLLSRRTF